MISYSQPLASSAAPTAATVSRAFSDSWNIGMTTDTPVRMCVPRSLRSVASEHSAARGESGGDPGGLPGQWVSGAGDDREAKQFGDPKRPFVALLSSVITDHRSQLVV